MPNSLESGRNYFSRPWPPLLFLSKNVVKETLPDFYRSWVMVETPNPPSSWPQTTFGCEIGWWTHTHRLRSHQRNRWKGHERRAVHTRREVVQVGAVVAIEGMVGRHVDRVGSDEYRAREKHLPLA